MIKEFVNKVKCIALLPGDHRPFLSLPHPFCITAKAGIQSFEEAFHMGTEVIKDLDIEKTIQSIIPKQFYNKLQYEGLKKILLHPCTDKATIQYRQDVIHDLAHHPELLDAFKQLRLPNNLHFSHNYPTHSVMTALL
jgi:hypothetical protein